MALFSMIVFPILGTAAFVLIGSSFRARKLKGALKAGRICKIHNINDEDFGSWKKRSA